MKFEKLKGEYTQLWASMMTRTSFKPAVEASASKIIANKERYQSVSEMTKVPWYVIGLIHQMEGGCSFGSHLHNGDSLARRTVHVPANRPPTGNGPFKWEASACDALLMKRLETITEWSIARICFELERFNGWGYRKFHKTTLTPYLWSGTTHYARGKYVADGKWDSTHVSKQTGAMALLKRMMELDETIRPSGALVEATPLQPEETAPTSFVKADEKAPVSRPAVAVGTTAAVIAVTEAAPAMIPPAVPQIVTEGLGNASAWRGVGETIWTFRDWAIAQPTMAGAVTIGVASFYLWSRRKAAQ